MELRVLLDEIWLAAAVPIAERRRLAQAAVARVQQPQLVQPGPQQADRGEDSAFLLESLITMVGQVAGCCDGHRFTITQAKFFLRSCGEPGTAMASRMSRFSKTRNAKCHPDVGLLEDLKSFLGNQDMQAATKIRNKEAADCKNEQGNVIMEGEVIQMGYAESAERCEDRSPNVGLEIKTGQDEGESLETNFAEEASATVSLTTTEKPAVTLTAGDQDGNGTTRIRNEEAADYDKNDDISEMADTDAEFARICAARKKGKASATLAQQERWQDELVKLAAAEAEAEDSPASAGPRHQQRRRGRLN